MMFLSGPVIVFVFCTRNKCWPVPQQMVYGNLSQMLLKSQKQWLIHTHLGTESQTWSCLLCSTDGVWWSSLCTGADVHPLWNQTAVPPEPLQHWPRVHRYKTCTESYNLVKCYTILRIFRCSKFMWEAMKFKW